MIHTAAVTIALSSSHKFLPCSKALSLVLSLLQLPAKKLAKRQRRKQNSEMLFPLTNNKNSKGQFVGLQGTQEPYFPLICLPV